ncbi:MAG: hypothetical protein ACLPX7_00530 [Xanthobacteraceae bacterium]
MDEHAAPQSHADSGYRDQFSRDRASSEHCSQVAAEDDEFFYVNPADRFVIGGLDCDAGLAGEKSTPETLTTACHAASWLA